jgi:pimeloyl-ACP methyl ester carboxylesterase
MPHSISGMYAMYWIEKYPDEVESMIALDITPPKTYLESPQNNFYNSLMYVGSRLGFHRQKWILNILGYIG